MKQWKNIYTDENEKVAKIKQKYIGTIIVNHHCNSFWPQNFFYQVLLLSLLWLSSLSYRLPFSPLIPWGPMSPLIPCSPGFPGGPIIPRVPFFPLIPSGPLFPGRPRAPNGPGDPATQTLFGLWQIYPFIVDRTYLLIASPRS